MTAGHHDEGPATKEVLFGMVTPSQITFQQGSPQPVVLAGNGTVNVGVDEACWQPLPGIENEDSDNAMRPPGSHWKPAK